MISPLSWAAFASTSVLVMLKSFAVLLAPQHSWARVAQIISWLLQNRLAMVVFNLLHRNGPWNAGHAKVDLETPLGKCSLSWVKDTCLHLFTE